MTKSDLKKDIKKYPLSYVYMATGILMMIIGFLVMDGYLTPTADLTAVAVFGYYMVLNAGIVLVISSIKISVDKHEDEIERIKRDKLLEELQQEEQS